MRVYLDEQVFETKLNPEDTVGELVEEVRATLGGTERMVMGIRADGLDITGEGYAGTLGKPIGSFDRYDFSTADPQQVVREALTDCHDLLADAEAKRSEAIDLFTRGESGKAVSILGECCRAWQQVHATVLNAMGLLKLDASAVSFREEPLEAALTGGRDQLEQVRAALAARDFVLISDILQYEFDPVIEGWHAALDAVLEATRPAPQNTY